MPITFRVLAVLLGIVIVYAAPMSMYKDVSLSDPDLFSLIKMHLVFIAGILFLYSGFRGVNLFTWEKD